jgi:CRP/FNR family transcriptional regulator
MKQPQTSDRPNQDFKMTLTSIPRQAHTCQTVINHEAQRAQNCATGTDSTPNVAKLTPYSRSTYAPGPSATEPRPLWQQSLSLVEQCVAFGRRRVHPGERVYLCGQNFDKLYLVNSGLFMIINLTEDGREQPAGFYFKGDWMGFDGILPGYYGCSAISLDYGEVWALEYNTLQRASASHPLLLNVLLGAMSEQLAVSRNAMLSMGTLAADARVADFLLQWAQALAERGMRTDQFNLHMTRADIGHYLGLTLESVSRALSRLARCGVIEFREKGRRDISIPNLKILREFVQNSAEPETTFLH